MSLAINLNQGEVIPVAKRKVKKKAWSAAKFSRCVADVKKKGGVRDPAAVCAARMHGTTKVRRKKRRRKRR